jgi:2,3-bisphosphoglycerate-independent phosphoglycerate mutase
MDVLISHELEVSIPVSEISDRLSEWNTVLTAGARSEFVKGVARFVGLDLIDYDSADIRRDPNGNFHARIRSSHWTSRQPT